MGRSSKNYSERELKQGRVFQCILYPDSDLYNCQELLDRLHPQGYWDKIFWILHDKDSYTELEVEDYRLRNPDVDVPFKEGDLKKSHYHVIGFRQNPMILGSAADKFGVPSNQVQHVKSLKSAVQYLVHKNNPEKYQYEISDVHYVGVSEGELKKYFILEVDSMDKAKLLYDYICGQSYVSMDMLVAFPF